MSDKMAHLKREYIIEQDVAKQFERLITTIDKLKSQLNQAQMSELMAHLTASAQQAEAPQTEEASA